MAAANDHADAGKNISPRRQSGRIDMCFDVVDADERHAERHRKHFRRADSDQKGADQSRCVMDRDAADLIERNVGLAQGFVDDGKQAL